MIILFLKRKQILRRGCDISYTAKIGGFVRFPHPIGIVIGEGVVIGEKVSIWHQVTVGSHGKKHQGVSYPIIGENTRVYAGAKVIGSIIVGKNVTIGANAVVTKSVADGATVVGVPGKMK